ncbi:MAG: dihydrolipoyl dehydrogenase [Candidatus Marinimicrobia bacterium]|jgi:dihydrolipoamide dehydrogenase|nr:dihydrolipoyl dehydrogenase [Candidatus Neomarinimicrobiota bacterium]MBT3496559.1 dihydrolipoyl dehydrogenase [Candidatus Neomarinimicrobiota bacterium]MBT3692336.1 dihydrolipoyl dehydrogenase [Candidatus Neomarinimicrobiota bacterium]MBT3731482.1 dihydrolipoyl dehydrogenase [Candidatus Neomarinimicrobiota bacterium]MBT4144897.1 dihydrolipoyl dehydrogenase [Candidatus Neomarinimicrobiota bacterium]
MSKTKFDLVVLGAGPGGYVAAIRASQLGLKTAIIEKDDLGGVCLNWGCIPTKALLKNAEVLHTIKNSKKYGIKVDGYSVDFPANIKRSRQVSERLSKGIGFLMKKNGITHLQGVGTLQDTNTLLLKKDGKTAKIEADKIIIATGARPRTFPGMEMDGRRIIGAREAMTLEAPPKEMIVIGSGAIGSEFAYYYTMFGTKVHMIEMLDRILPMEDEDVSKEVEKSFKKSGMKIYKSTKVNKVEALKSKVKVHTEHNGESKIIEGELALLAVGVQGNIENIGLEKVGIQTEKNAIVINEMNQTNIPNIYAIGDVSGPPWLAHVASAQGHVAAEHAASHITKAVDYSNIPGCTYCQPQVGSLGLTEAQALRQGFDIKVGRFDFRASGKAMATGDTTGFVKLIFDKKYGELLGAHIVGSEATELIAELGMAKALESTWEELAMTVHAHPTLSESIMEAALDAFSGSIHQ